MTTIRALLLGILLCEPCCASPADREVGALLRDGTWDGGVGTYHPPEVFSAIKPAAWPADGWYRIRLEADRAGEFGWDSSIDAIADIDGDGLPDFVISVGGNNSGYEAVLLSSTAKPGRNAPTASLTSTGC